MPTSFARVHVQMCGTVMKWLYSTAGQVFKLAYMGYSRYRIHRDLIPIGSLVHLYLLNTLYWIARSWLYNNRLSHTSSVPEKTQWTWEKSLLICVLASLFLTIYSHIDEAHCFTLCWRYHLMIVRASVFCSGGFTIYLRKHN